MKLLGNKRFRKLLPLVFVILVLISWEVLVRALDVSKFILPPPSKIVEAFLSDPSRFATSTAWTAYEAFLGFSIGLVVGVFLAALISQFRTLDHIITPYLVLIQVTPMVAIAPLLVIWFGFGLAPKVVIAFLISFFPITINTVIGLRSADRDALDLMRVLAATGHFSFLRVKMPFALPYLLSGIKIAAPAAVIGAIVAEFVSSTRGLGFVILSAKAQLRIADIFVAIVGSALLGITMFSLSVFAESRLLRWHESQMR